MTDLELLLAQAMCGRGAPCRYHVAQAKIAVNALAGAGMVVVLVEVSEAQVRNAELLAQPAAAE